MLLLEGLLTLGYGRCGVAGGDFSNPVCSWGTLNTLLGRSRAHLAVFVPSV